MKLEKRLAVDVPVEVHQELKNYAHMCNTTIKKIVLGLILQRLKLIRKDS